MSEDSPTTEPSKGMSPVGHCPAAPLPILGLLALVTVLAGCSGQSVTNRLNFTSPRPATATAAAAAPVSSDPIIAAAARARPGQEERVTLDNGQTASVRVVRTYFAASGRECREVGVGAGLGERQRLICAAETGWSDARPLLRGGAGQQ